MLKMLTKLKKVDKFDLNNKGKDGINEKCRDIFKERSALPIVMGSAEYFLQANITIFGILNIILGCIWMSIALLYSSKSRRNQQILGVNSCKIIIQIMNIVEISILSFIIYTFSGQADQYLILLPFPQIFYFIQQNISLIWLKLILLILLFILNICCILITPELKAQLVLIQIIIVIYIYIIYSMVVNSCLNGKLNGKEKEENNLKIERDLLNKIPNSILVYNKYKGIIHINLKFKGIFTNLRCKDFTEFAEKCKVPKTENTLRDDINNKIDYFNSSEALLKEITQLSVDYQFKRTKALTTFSNFSQKEFEIKFYKGRGMDKNEILLIMKENKKETQQLEKKVVQRYKNMISKSICHDLKSPLNGIITPIENIPPKYMEILPVKMIRMSAQLLEYKIEDMIDYSQLELDEFKAIYKPFNVRELLIKLKKLSKIQVDMANLSIKVDLDRNAPEMFVADGKRITQIMLHLIQNAIKFTNSGLIIIYVERKSMNLEFGVKDVGLGMSPCVQRYLLHFLKNGINSPMHKYEEEDSQIEQTEQTEMGLGLWITEKICEGIGSKLEFISSQNNGSIFYFEVEDKTKSTSFIKSEIAGETGEEDAPRKKRRNTKRRITLESKISHYVDSIYSRKDIIKVDNDKVIEDYNSMEEEEKVSPKQDVLPPIVIQHVMSPAASFSEEDIDSDYYNSILRRGSAQMKKEEMQPLFQINTSPRLLSAKTHNKISNSC